MQRSTSSPVVVANIYNIYNEKLLIKKKKKCEKEQNAKRYKMRIQKKKNTNNKISKYILRAHNILKK
jgi:hypothetical protein